VSERPGTVVEVNRKADVGRRRMPGARPQHIEELTQDARNLAGEAVLGKTIKEQCMLDTIEVVCNVGSNYDVIDLV
jgi:hypothetical protein